MPEGPSIIILREEVQRFRGKKILDVSGNTKADKKRLLHKTVKDFKSWGKHFLICFRGFYVRIHFLMWGSYRINEKKDASPRLHLKFQNGELNFYSCSLKIIDGDVNEDYNWETDVMSEKWNAAKVMKRLKNQQEEMVCDVLMDQEIFTGVGNIIKNEVLFRLLIHPESIMKAIPMKKKKELINEARIYSFQFYEWKKIFELKKHWKIYRKKICPRCGGKITVRHTGKRERRSFFCENCQRLYVAADF